MARVLLEEGRITPEQFASAMGEQGRTGAFIGDILVEQGVIDEGSLLSFLAKHCKVPHLSLLDYLIDGKLASLLPQDICLKHRLLPIDKLGRNLTVAMVNPLDTAALGAVQALCPELRIKPILCAHRHFEMVAARLFNTPASGEPAALSATSLGLMGRPGVSAATPAPPAAPTAPTPAEAQTAEAEPPPESPAPVADEVPVEEAAPPPPPEDAGEREVAESPAPDTTETTPPGSDSPVASAEPPAEEPPSATAPPEPALRGPDGDVDDDDEVAFPYAIAVGDEDDENAPLSEDSLLRSAFKKAPASAVPAQEGKPDAMQDMAHAMINSLRGTYAILARRMELFRHIPPEHVARIFARGATLEFEAGHTIFEKGELGDKMYAILIGEVEIRDGDRCLAVLDRGDMFGEMALLGGALRSATACALVNTSVLALDQQAIRTVLPPEVTVQLLTNIVVTLSGRLRDANEQLQSLNPPKAAKP